MRPHLSSWLPALLLLAGCGRGAPGAPLTTAVTRPEPPDEPAAAEATPDEPRAATPTDPLAAIATALQAGQLDVDTLLADPRHLALHADTEFRALVRTHAPVGAVTMVTADEPGPRIAAHGRIVDARGEPLAGVNVYAYQTDVRGWYSADAPHVGGSSGDQEHARLFGHVRTDAAGRYELRTIHPNGYPGTDLPAHIHVEVEGLVSEILFADDPRLTPAARKPGVAAGFQVAEPRPGPDGVTRYEANFTVRR